MQTRQKTSRLLPGALALVFSALQIFAADSYHAPEPGKAPFDADKCSLTPQERTNIATNLAVFVKNTPPDAPGRMTAAAKALGIALRLDPANRTATDANAQLRDGQRLAAVLPATDPKLIAADLQIKAEALKLTGGADDWTLAGYLLDLALLIDPPGRDAAHGKDFAKSPGARSDWSFAVPSSASDPSKNSVQPFGRGIELSPSATPIPRNAERDEWGDPVDELPRFTLKTTSRDRPAGKVAMVLSNQAAVRGLLVCTPERGREFSGASQLTARVVPFGVSECVLAQPAGKPMTTAFYDACRFLQSRYPVVQPGAQVVLDFRDKPVARDGGSAGAAFALLLLSVFEGFDFAPDVAVAGSIGADGNLHAVAGVPAKIRGALLDGCKVASIPLANKKDIADMALLFPSATLWQIQTLTAETIGEALINSRKDRPENLTKALRLFGKVQAALDANPHAHLLNPAVRALLQQVLDLAPNHLSAEFLLQQAAGTAPRALSLDTSIAEIFNAASPVLKLRDNLFARAAGGDYRAAFERLGSLQFKVNPRAFDYCRAMIAFLHVREQWDTSGRSHSLEKELAKQQEAVAAALQKLRQDHTAPWMQRTSEN